MIRMHICFICIQKHGKHTQKTNRNGYPQGQIGMEQKQKFLIQTFQYYLDFLIIWLFLFAQKYFNQIEFLSMKHINILEKPFLVGGLNRISNTAKEKIRDSEGNGNPLQYSCLENPMGRRAQWATVHRVTKSQTQLID